MRGHVIPQSNLVVKINLEDLVRLGHPLGAIKLLADTLWRGYLIE